ncbi:discoidin domain-containing protein [Oleiharenicola lentus]|uniref:discoidin domain-containing protein n=1 Tax=Oleiharenicola lentus TaxID=2508720 RepID=UPI003F67878A
MKQLNFSSMVQRMVTAMALVLIAVTNLQAQDRNIAVNEVYPADMFKLDNVTNLANEPRRIINVKNLAAAGIHTASAVGDGVADDSDAIIAAMDFVINQLKSFWAATGTPPSSQHWDESWIIYFPNGTYRVTKPLVYSGGRVVDPNFRNDANREGTERLMLVGQSRAGAIIKLTDNAPGFGASVTKPVVAFSRFDIPTTNNNMPASFQFRNLTINTGTGNPGAVGVDFYGANRSRLDNVRIVGDGKIGIHFRIATAHGYYSNVIVDGMDYGIYIQDLGATGTGGSMETHSTFEYVSLNNQAVAGIYQAGVSSSFRKVQSSNAVPGVRLVAVNGRLPHMTILDSSFTSGLANFAAIQVDAGELYSRNITVAGYGSSVNKGSAVAATGAITEYLTTPAIVNNGRANSTVKSMNLPIEEYPLVPWISDFTQWANVNSYTGTDVQKVQAALNSGKKVVYFPNNTYTFGTAGVTIPATVEQLIGAGTYIVGTGNLFTISGASSQLLLFSGFTLNSGQVLQTAQRDVLFETSYSRDNFYQSNLTAPGTKLYINNTTGFARNLASVNYTTSWVRWNDNEKGSDWQFTASTGSTMWMLGFKSEKTYSVFRVEPGAKLEVLGGVMSRQGTDASPDRVGIYNNGELSIVTATIRNSATPAAFWSPMIQDVQTGLPTLNLAMTYAGFVPRGWSDNIIVPLYASYAPSGLDAPLAPTNLTAIAGNQQAALSWNASASATSYNVFRGTTSNGQGGTPLITGVATTSYTNTGLTNGTTYYYKVAAVNANGAGSLSNEAVATPGTGTVKLIPSSASASDNEFFNPPANAIDGNTSTRWSASVLSCPPAHWLKIDLGSVKTVNTVKTWFYNNLLYTYDIAVSTDNVLFTTVVPSHNTSVISGWETDTFAPIGARYIRINISSKNGGGPNTKPGIREAEVYQ